MRLIVETGRSVDYAASWTDVNGVEYESAEQFLFDLELKFEKIRAIGITFCGITFYKEDHVFGHGDNKKFVGPDVYTVDQWFKKELCNSD